VTWQQQDPKRSERWLSAGLIVAFVVVLGGLAYVISNRSAPDEDAGRATNTTKVQATTEPPSSTAATQTTTLGATTTVATTTTLPPTTTTRPTTTAPTTTTAAVPPGPVREQPDGLFCRDLKARGYTFPQALAYWLADGRPARMDADGNGIPCETVYPPAEVKKKKKPRARR